MSFMDSWRKKGKAVPAKNETPAVSVPDNRPPEINILSAFNESLQDLREKMTEQCCEINKQHKMTEPATDLLGRAKELMKEAEHAAEESIITFIKDLNKLKGFDVVGSRNGAPLTDSSKDFYIFHDLGKDVNPELLRHSANVFSRNKLVMSLHIRRESPVAYSADPSPDPDKTGDPRYILIENFKGGSKRAKCYGDERWADRYLRAYHQEMANIFYTSYMPDIAEEIAYSMPQIGKGHINDLRPMIKTLQQNFQDHLSEAYDKRIQVKLYERIRMKNALATFPQNPKSMDVCKDWFYNDFMPAYEPSGDEIKDAERSYVIGLFQHLAQGAEGNRTTMAQSYFEDPVIDRICTNIKTISPYVGRIIDICNKHNPRVPDGACGTAHRQP